MTIPIQPHPVRSQLGPDNCTVTEDITSESVVFVPPGSTVCFQCVLSGSVATDATFQINSGSVDSSDGSTEMGVLVIYNTDTVFLVQQPAAVGCTSTSEAESATSTVILHSMKPESINLGTLLTGYLITTFCSFPASGDQWAEHSG